MSFLPDPSMIRDVQRALGVTVDGVAGIETWRAIYRHFVGDASLASLPEAIRAIQTALKFPPYGRDGIAGAATWMAIHRAVPIPLTAEDSTPSRQDAKEEKGGVAESDSGSVLAPSRLGGETSAPAPVALMADERSEAAIATLHPRVRPLARELVLACGAHGMKIVVTSALRTYAQQDLLFSQGRTRSGKIVTKARGGYSNHNFGLAFDVTLFVAARPVYESPLYKAIAAIGKSLGLTWGGDWESIHDEPHFELRPDWAEKLSEGAMLSGLRDRREAGRDAFSA